MPTPSTPYPKPSFAGKLDILPALSSILFSGLYALVTGFRRSNKDEPSLFLHVAYAAVRKLGTRLSAAQSQWVFLHTDALYRKHAKAAKAVDRTVELNHGAKGHWIGDPDASHVLVWYHGGGFTLPALEGHMGYLFNLIKSRKDKKLAIFVLTYTLAPTGKYPTQLTQAVEALRYLVEQAGRRPSQITLGGDSAGGNLVAGVLSHLAHPHASIKPLKLSEPLSSAVVMAPWISLDPSVVKLSGYEGSDIITRQSITTWAKSYIGNAPHDYYTDVSLAPADWFSTYPVKKILVLAGQNEYLLPSINDFVKKLEAGFGNVEYYVAEREAHIAPFINLVVHYKTPTGQGKKLNAWLEDIVASS